LPAAGKALESGIGGFTERRDTLATPKLVQGKVTQREPFLPITELNP